ncbi:RIO1 family regulatory kinase/ATPase [Alkanindiges sp. WGS2144]|uniref:RIO1 family regulatory kinase/ATPase domain-containing protein n=1 Tax=Alkanindiges sp. WGS2144 TaxID=3366808 RepID=UPI0037539501
MTSAIDFLKQKIKTQQHNIASYTFNGHTVWIKKASRRHPMWLYRLLGWVMRFLGIQALMPVPNLGGAQAISTEVTRLKELAALGIRVPKVLAHYKHGLMLEDVGNHAQPAQHIDALLANAESPSACLELFKLTVRTILEVHQRGAWLSEAFARNILMDESGRLAFIDFEDDPATYMPPVCCYARDWLCFMFSVAARLNHHQIQEVAIDYLKQQLAKEPAATQHLVFTACERLSWLRKLPVQKLGKDGQRLLATAELLNLMRTETSL